MKAVLTSKRGSGYDDVVEERYHFPSTYLAQVEKAVGDFIVYYEPRRRDEAAGGKQAYFAVARIIGVESDPNQRSHYYARIADYLDFDELVPFRGPGGYFESMLERADGRTNKGAFGRSVRNISDEEFDAIMRAGFPLAEEAVATATASRKEVDEEEPAPFIRPMVESTTTRWFRDRAFTRHIQEAYRKTCAITGLQIVNGGGRPEVQAAHIRPVANEGSDSVRNGLALSSTVHWMFDRGLISVGDDYKVLLAPSGVPDAIQRLVNPSGRLLLPVDPRVWPHPHFLSYHRDNVFKG
jgi:putative restriction endonuclease